MRLTKEFCRTQIKHVLIILILSPVWTYLMCPSCRDSLRNIAVGTLFSSVIWVSQWKGHEYITNWLSDKISWLEQPQKRFFWGVVAVILYTVVSLTIVLYIFYLTFGFTENMLFTVKGFLNFMAIAIGIATVIGLFMHSRAFLFAWRQTAINAERHKAENLSSQYESLKNQVNPHFLFNSLNVLTSLIPKDQATSVKFVKKLSQVYRYVLDNQDKEVVPLLEELHFLESFVFLQKIRFQEHLNVEIDLPKQSDIMVPPLSLQMLMENAIKHNEVSAENPLSVTLYLENDEYLVMSNNLQKKNQPIESSGIGLENIKARYEFLTDKLVQILNEQGRFEVKLPVLKFKPV
ncbi:MAG: sensor histidine kinase [Cyclobacteriaceae bacterium]